MYCKEILRGQRDFELVTEMENSSQKNRVQVVQNPSLKNITSIDYGHFGNIRVLQSIKGNQNIGFDKRILGEKKIQRLC